MTPGQFARRVLGRNFHIAGEAYRRIFVDMSKVVAFVSEHTPPGAKILDVGGGDGYAANLLLSLRSDVQLTLIDVAPIVGSVISPANASRTTLRPATPIDRVDGRFDLITLTDVIHHVPLAERAAFFHSLSETAARTGCRKIVIKDIEPGNLRALLALWGDLYVTGDRGVTQIEADAIVLPGFRRAETEMIDFPNYCLVFLADHLESGDGVQ
jgi:hypothetical protein